LFEEDKPTKAPRGDGTACAPVKLSLFQENNLSNRTPHWVECQTEEVNHLSLSLQTWKTVNIILSKLKFID